MFKRKIYQRQDKAPSQSNHRYYESEKNHSPLTPCCVAHHKSSFIQEFLCHLPMSILALCVSLLCVVFFDGALKQLIAVDVKSAIYNDLFHVSHYIHILLSSFASFFVFRSHFVFNNVFWGVAASLVNSFFFCTLADIILPSLGGALLGYDVALHLCFLHTQDLLNVLLFASFGIFAAYALSKGDRKFGMLVAEKVHLGHVWSGCIASLFYLLSQIHISYWANEVGWIVLLLFFSVVAPCIFSDFCVPFLFSLGKRHNNEFQDKKVDFY
jgi:hypothetical protein